MMAHHLYVAGFLLSLHAAQSYILLTANLDDVHAIAKQIAESPVAGQLNQIIRRASTIFNDQIQKTINAAPEQRANEKTDEGGKDDNFEIWKPEKKGNECEQIVLFRLHDTSALGQEFVKSGGTSNTDSDSSEVSSENNDKVDNRVERRHGASDLVELGKNASFYLKSIKKIFESV